MLSPFTRAFLIDSKIVSTVFSACFWVSWRFDTRMAIRSLFNMCGLRVRSAVEKARRAGTLQEVRRYVQVPKFTKLRQACAHFVLHRSGARVSPAARSAPALPA